MTAMLKVEGLEQRFDISGGLLDRLKPGNGRLLAPRRVVRAVNGVSLEVQPGEVLALVGESGCGKSTVAKTIARIHTPTAGRISIAGQEVQDLLPRDLLPVRARMQMIFQDPYASLNPRQKVRDIVAEPLAEQTGDLAAAREVADRLLSRVGLNAEHGQRYPHQFSGGQRQRIGIARALSVNPGLIIADEPVSALDVSIQAQILNLMMDLRDEYGLAYLFISHDLSVVNHIADRVAVMYLGFMVETAPRGRLFAMPRHPYTRALLSAAPALDPAKKPQQIELTGEVPSALALPSGCCFRTRCPFAWERCAVERPQLQDADGGHMTACHLLDEPHRDTPNGGRA